VQRKIFVWHGCDLVDVQGSQVLDTKCWLRSNSIPAWKTDILFIQFNLLSRICGGHNESLLLLGSPVCL
jgi:hypothetical protein